MTLMGVILRKVASLESVASSKKYPSPPPEVAPARGGRRRKYVDKFAHVKSKVDTSPPPLDPSIPWRHLQAANRNSLAIDRENMKLLIAIRRTYFMGGKVDSRWRVRPRGGLHRFHQRVNFIKRIEKDNLRMHKLFTTAQPKVATTSQHNKDWQLNRRRIIAGAENKFVLFPEVELVDVMEDPAFLPAEGVRRPRVTLHLALEGGCRLGSLRVELFADVCPRACALFAELLAGRAGLGYEGTRFFRKVPHLYWSGGDVARDDGSGCYAPLGRRTPLAPENYHFSHSMPGLLSMRVTAADEVCGIFNITFKPLPQLDLRNVVFGRVIRPSATYSAMEGLGSPLSPRPVVRLAASQIK